MTDTTDFFEIKFPGESPENYSQNNRKKCFFCKRREGDKEVIEINEIPIPVTINLHEITFPMYGMKNGYYICSSHLNFLNGLINQAFSLNQLESSISHFEGSVKASKELS